MSEEGEVEREVRLGARWKGNMCFELRTYEAPIIDDRYQGAWHMHTYALWLETVLYGSLPLLMGLVDQVPNELDPRLDCS